MLTIEQFLIMLTCVGGCGYTSYYLGFKKGGEIHTTVYMAIMEEFLSKKMGEDWFRNTFGKDNQIFNRFIQTELTETDQ